MNDPYIVGICGSTRLGSSNHALLTAAEKLLVNAVGTPACWKLAESITQLPHFVPGEQSPPSIVVAFRALLTNAAGILICCPEYAHGIPGSLKNALDWLVATVVTEHKPTVIWSASPTGGEFSHPQLIEVMRTMSADVLTDRSLQITNARAAVQLDGNVTNEELRARLQGSVVSLWHAARVFAAKPA
jgi:chromate reductase, NAD(P)H dehydrogenase (quinone)